MDDKVVLFAKYSTEEKTLIENGKLAYQKSWNC